MEVHVPRILKLVFVWLNTFVNILIQRSLKSQRICCVQEQAAGAILEVENDIKAMT